MKVAAHSERAFTFWEERTPGLIEVFQIYSAADGKEEAMHEPKGQTTASAEPMGNGLTAQANFPIMASLCGRPWWSGGWVAQLWRN